MEKQLKDYLHLYGNKPLVWFNKISGAKKEGFLIGKQVAFSHQIKGGMANRCYTVSVGTMTRDFNLALRPLSDITEDELEQIAHIDDTYIFHSMDDAIETARNIIKSGEYHPLVTKFLLDNGFDIFDLIKCGLAIVKPTILAPTIEIN